MAYVSAWHLINNGFVTGKPSYNWAWQPRRKKVLQLKGYETVQANRTYMVTIDPVQNRRNKFCKGVSRQIALVGSGWQKNGIEKERDPRWFWAEGGYLFTGIRYGNRSMTDAGQAYKFKNNADLTAFYNTLLEACQNGDFDADLETISNEMAEKLAGPLAKARAARAANKAS